MPRRSELFPHLDFRRTLVEPGGTVEDRIRLVAEARRHSPDLNEQIDRVLLEENARLRTGLEEAGEHQEKLKALLEKLASPPWHEAVFLGTQSTPRGARALILFAGCRRVVGLSEEVDPASLQAGDTVFLNEGLNAVMARSDLPEGGETAFFERHAPQGRIVLKCRDEEVLVNPGACLCAEDLRPGDQVRWDRRSLMAYEKIERSRGDGLFLEETPEVAFEDIGGLDTKIEELKEALVFRVQHPDVARRYGLERVGSILFVGPAGTGKTMVAKGVANFLRRLSNSGGSRFINVKPGALHSMWYAQSEANYREVFRVAREAAERGGQPVVLFFDEVDSICAARGQSVTRVDDRVLLAFASELDGLQARGNVLVIAATNRREALDPALARPGRLGDKVVELPRPDRQAAEAIFGKHLGPDLPYAAGGVAPDAARETIIQAAASRIYSPNGAGDLATILFRDGKRQPVRPADLVSGAVIAKISKTAKDQAARRAVKSGQEGIMPEDVLDAISDEFESAVRMLTRSNCHLFLSHLPTDVDVVDIKPVMRRVKKPHRFLTLAPGDEA